MKRKIFLFCFIIFNGCSFFQNDPVLLQINEKKWTRKDFAFLLANKINSLIFLDIKQNLVIEKLKEELVIDLLVEYIVHQWAKEHSIQVSKKEWEKELKKMSSKFPSKEVFELYLKRKKINKTTWKNKIKNKLLINKVMQKIGASAKPPALQEMLSYYKNSQDKFKTKESILIRHFFYKKKVKIFKAKAALEKDKNWNRSIVEPKWVEKGVLAVFNKAFLMRKNSVSPILTSDYGYHIIHVLDKKSAKQESFKEAKAKISKFLLEKKQQALFMKWLDKEKKKIKVFKDEKVFQNIQVKWQ